jgi:hypothetical protein
MQRLARGVGTLARVFILFFCTSGGLYTTEALIHSVGPGLGLLILVLLPLIWSLPEALIVGELASMLPKEGVTIGGSIARLAASGLFKMAGSPRCTRSWIWQFIQSSSISISVTSQPDWICSSNSSCRLR